MQWDNEISLRASSLDGERKKQEASRRNLFVYSSHPVNFSATRSSTRSLMFFYWVIHFFVCWCKNPPNKAETSRFIFFLINRRWSGTVSIKCAVVGNSTRRREWDWSGWRCRLEQRYEKAFKSLSSFIFDSNRRRNTDTDSEEHLMIAFPRCFRLSGWTKKNIEKSTPANLWFVNEMDWKREKSVV